MNLENIIEVEINEKDLENYKRLDQFLSHKVDDCSRMAIKKLFEKEHIKISPNSPHQTFKLELKKMPKAGTILQVCIPEATASENQPENIPLEILFEDEYLLFINKPPGMVVHPAPGHPSGTLVNAILHHCPNLKGIGHEKRPGIVHRLDKGTTGIMVVAKEQKCHTGLVELFSKHAIDRIYEALVMGVRMPPSGTLKSTIGRHPSNRLKMTANPPRGKEAITYYEVLSFFKHHAHVQLKLETGRTHQIRVHLNELLKKPILCDPLYGNPNEHLRRLGGIYKSIIGTYPHPFLHAKKLGLIHPITKEKLSFEIPAPKIFQDVLKISHES